MLVSEEDKRESRGKHEPPTYQSKSSHACVSDEECHHCQNQEGTPKTTMECGEILNTMEGASSPVTSLGTEENHSCGDESPEHSPMYDVSPKSLAQAAGISCSSKNDEIDEMDIDDIRPSLPSQSPLKRKFSSKDLQAKHYLLTRKLSALKRKFEQQQQDLLPLLSSEPEETISCHNLRSVLKRRKISPSPVDPFETDDESADEAETDPRVFSSHPIEQWRRARDQIAARWHWLQKRIERTRHLADTCCKRHHDYLQQRQQIRKQECSRSSASCAREMPVTRARRTLVTSTCVDALHPFRPKNSGLTLDTVACRAALLDRRFHPVLSFTDDLPSPVERIVEFARRKRLRSQAAVMAAAVRQRKRKSDNQSPPLSHQPPSLISVRPSSPLSTVSTPSPGDSDEKRERRRRSNSESSSVGSRARRNSSSVDNVVIPPSMVPARIDTSLLDVAPIPIPKWNKCSAPSSLQNSPAEPLSDDHYSALHEPLAMKERQRYVGKPVNKDTTTDNKSTTSAIQPCITNADKRISWPSRTFPLRGDDLQDLSRQVPKAVASSSVYQIVLPGSKQESSRAGPMKLVLKLGPKTDS